jgi:hypothetical protein
MADNEKTEHDLKTLVELVTRIAKAHYESNLTVLHFAEGFKCVFGTLDESYLDEAYKNPVRKMKAHSTLEEALVDAIVNKIHF